MKAYILGSHLLLISALVLIAGCSTGNNQGSLNLSTGDIVKVDYIGTFDDGKVFDTSVEAKAKESGTHQAGRPYQPLPVTLGQGGVIAGFEKAIRSLKGTGDTVKVRLTPEEGYGPSDPKKIGEVPLEVFTKAGITPTVGAVYPFQNMQATVVALSGDTVTLDANHPMAGKVLNFEITLREVTKAQK